MSPIPPLSAPPAETFAATLGASAGARVPARPRFSPASLLAVATAHGVALALLLTDRADVAEAQPKPLQISLIVAADETPKPLPRPAPVPTPRRPEAKPPAPVLAATRPAPTPRPAVEPVVPEPPTEPLPEPTPQPTPPAAAAVQTVEAPPLPPAPPAPPTPPRAADYLNNPKPPYPALSRRLAEEGTVRLRVLVNADGSVARLEIMHSSGFARLDEVAARTVQSSWKFEPAQQGGKPVAAWVTVPIQFTLRS